MAYILLTGRPGSGKSTVARILQKERGLGVINMGELLHQALIEIGVHCQRRADIGPAFLAHFPASSIAERMERAAADRGDTIFDGVRLSSTCRQLLERSPGSSVWLIEAPEPQRLARLRRRIEEEQPYSTPAQVDEILARYGSYDCEEAGLQELADVVLVNKGTLHSLRKKVLQSYAALEEHGPFHALRRVLLVVNYGSGSDPVRPGGPNGSEYKARERRTATYGDVLPEASDASGQILPLARLGT